MISYQPIKPNSIIINEFDDLFEPSQRFNISNIRGSKKVETQVPTFFVIYVPAVRG